MAGDDPEGPFPPGADRRGYDQLRRRVLWSMPIGLYLLGTRAGSERNLMTTSLVMQVSISPKLVGAAIESSSRTMSLLRAGQCFCVVLLPKSERGLVRKFVKPATFDETAHELNGVSIFDAPVTGSPVPMQALGYLDCRLHDELELGSHHLVIGEVLDAAFVREDALESDGVLEMSDTRMSYGG